ncbi:2-phospho-L-lactate transferase [Streptomyces fagopyri]|uniref:2-phospho-L-lactate transferase n=1 Tax=Streptomyces fagopyri TaxID=2662397 RepID=UPI0033E3E1BB
MRITVLTGGIGGARFLRGLRQTVGPAADITVIGNTGDDIDLFGLRVCPDLDTVMYTLGGGIDETQGWGRATETWSAKAELAAYGAEPDWFGLGDKDLATHLVRTRMLAAGRPLSSVTAALCARWQPGVRLLPMTDDRVETRIEVERDGRRRTVHLQEYWVKLRAALPARSVVLVGADKAVPAPGVLDALGSADVILLAPSNPVVSIGTILAVPGIRAALATAAAPVVGLSPIIGTGPVRGMANQVLQAVGVAATASAVAGFYGSRRDTGVLDGWLVDSSDAGQVGQVAASGIVCRAVPLWMTDVATTTSMAQEALLLAKEVRGA